MKTYRCDEMMCNGCVSRINKGLDHEGIGQFAWFYPQQ